MQKVYYGITVRAGTPQPHPGTAIHARDRRRIQILVVSLYLVYTIYEADHVLRTRQPNYYQLLSLPATATEREVKSRLRRLAALHHPDKTAPRSSSNGQLDGSHNFFIVLQLAAETLADPAKRFAYERFGPVVHAWKLGREGKGLTTIKDFMTNGLTLQIPYYLAGAAGMYLLSALGYLRHAQWWRWTFFAVVFAFELFVVTRSGFPKILTDAINPFFELLASVTNKTTRQQSPAYLPFQLVALVRHISVTTYIAFNQLGPLLRQANYIPEGKQEEERALEHGLEGLEQSVAALDAAAGRLVDMEMTPFVGDTEALGSLKGKVRDWLVQNTVRADPLVKDSIGASMRKRRLDAPHGIRGTK